MTAKAYTYRWAVSLSAGLIGQLVGIRNRAHPTHFIHHSRALTHRLERSFVRLSVNCENICKKTVVFIMQGPYFR
jgi:hypothetical protein